MKSHVADAVVLEQMEDSLRIARLLPGEGREAIVSYKEGQLDGYRKPDKSEAAISAARRNLHIARMDPSPTMWGVAYYRLGVFDGLQRV